MPIEERNIGIVFQSYALFPTMTVYDNIAFGLQDQENEEGRGRTKSVREIAKKVDLSDEQLKKAVSQLSGGQQQRVAIARALVTRSGDHLHGRAAFQPRRKAARPAQERA